MRRAAGEFAGHGPALGLQFSGKMSGLMEILNGEYAYLLQAREPCAGEQVRFAVPSCRSARCACWAIKHWVALATSPTVVLCSPMQSALFSMCWAPVRRFITMPSRALFLLIRGSVLHMQHLSSASDAMCACALAQGLQLAGGAAPPAVDCNGIPALPNGAAAELAHASQNVRPAAALACCA